MGQNHKGNTIPQITQEEHATAGGIDAKKVFVFDNNGNQITSFGGGGGNVTLNRGPNFIGIVTVANSLFFSDGVAWNESGGNALVNVQNFAIGQFGGTDATANNLTSALDFAEELVFNGTSWDRVRSVQAASGATGVGLLASGLMGNDGTNWRPIRVGTDGRLQSNETINAAWPDPKTFIGLATVTPGVAWPDPNRFIGLVTVAGTIANLALDPSGYIGLVTIGGGLINIAPSGTVLNTYSIHLTTNTTTTPTAVTAYISSIAISNEVAGTTSTITIQDKQGTPLKLVNGLSTTALTTTPTIITFNTPVKMVSGIDIITAGAVAATIDVWINYYQ